MQNLDTSDQLSKILKDDVSAETFNWINKSLDEVISKKSAKDLYLTYSLIAGKITPGTEPKISGIDKELADYLRIQNATVLQISRIYILCRVLQADRAYFSAKVANLIQVADTSELETFLKFLILLPHAEDYKQVGVEALRTNIEIIFDAIALNNPYPSQHFNNQQWNQMYLKAAFMQRKLENIVDVDKMANSDLARIISDYAHERWAASRDIDPVFWRPATNFIEGVLLEDMDHLFRSKNKAENLAAALCCFNSQQKEATKLLDKYPDLLEKVANKAVSWENLKNKL
ncbi:EboA domain-containing protein [uncultured Eudoraea sp.]|uniref:EboA domain-containing protein n=1 Tax=uncultured Eudoraea sp. TaxID=1035614 RepID=UPI00260CB97A|nr:EboA domain-containing protein [uncultured Eudoraea sp.]